MRASTDAGPVGRFEAAILDWDAALARRTPVERLRQVVEQLCGRGFDIGFVSTRKLDEVDGRLAARPAGPGCLYLCPDGGAEIFVVGPGGPVRIGVGGDFGSGPRLLAELRGRGIDPRGALLLAEGEPGPLELLEDQLARREQLELPRVAAEPGWTLELDGLDPEREPACATLLTLADGLVGTPGCPVLAHPAAAPRVLAAVYEGEGARTALLECVAWNLLPGELGQGAIRRVLDLRAGLVRQDLGLADGSGVSAVLFSSLARPGCAVLRAEAPVSLLAESTPLAATAQAQAEVSREDGVALARMGTGAGRVGVAAAEEHLEFGPLGRLDRVAVYRAGDGEAAPVDGARADLAGAREAGFDRLLAEHRRAWARRWENADVVVEGDPELQLAVRFALFHLIASVADSGEAAVGARGLSGPAYRGHVFWDSDVFVLPFLAATHPPAARAMLEYRIRRLPVAQAAARRSGRAGARFPWESAAVGEDVTPPLVHDRSGRVIPIRTGLFEEHVTADVAWASACYEDWTGDEEFAAGPGRELLVETARYWASRIRLDGDGRGHIYGVIGPDEYHEPVDDNAYTNVMARWNLRRAATLVPEGSGGVTGEERESWLRAAGSLVDGHDPETGLYEQFAGFFKLEPLVAESVLSRRPLAAESLIERGRLRQAQIVKQTDVLMLHHLVAEETVPGSLLPNLLFYEPRTTHGSSLSAGIHAGLLARAGLLEEAVGSLRTAGRLDLDDLTGNTAEGLHLATMGSVWQALAFGFAGLRPAQDALRIDPRLPADWTALGFSVRFRGSRVRVRVERGGLAVAADPPAAVHVAGTAGPTLATTSGIRFERRRERWAAP